jgi:hypothetical protein
VTWPPSELTICTVTFIFLLVVTLGTCLPLLFWDSWIWKGKADPEEWE